MSQRMEKLNNAKAFGACLLIALLVLPGLWVTSAQAAPAAYKGSSADGSIVFFETEERLVLGDTDSRRDVYERSFDPNVEGGTYVTREVSTGPTGGNDAFNALFEGASPDGELAFFSTEESLVNADKDKRSDVYVRDLSSGLTELVSVPEETCGSGCGNGEFVSIYVGSSADGNVVFFTTNEPLSEHDSDSSFDLYARNLTTDKSELVSRSAVGCSGECGNGSTPATFEGSSADGSVVFFTTAESLAAADVNQSQDIYRRNLVTDTTTLASPGEACPVGLECDAVYRGATPDGGSVFFQTKQALVAADTDDASDLYAWSAGTLTLVSRPDPSCGACANESEPATFAAASDDGTKVLFQSGERLASGDADAWTDLYERDLAAGTTTLVSPAGTCPAAASSCAAIFRAASADAGTVFFQTTERLDSADTDDAIDIYVRDVEGGTTKLVSVASDSCLSCGSGPAEARFAALAAGATEVFFSTADKLSAGDGDTSTDVYVRDLDAGTTTLATPSGVCPLPGEAGCDSNFEAVSADGTHLTFSTLERLGAEDVDSEADVYQRAEGTTRLISTGNSVELGPATPILTATSPPSPNPSLEPAVLGQSDPGTAIKIYSTPDCSGAPVNTGTAAQLGGSGIAVTVEPGTTTVLRATATDSNGDTSACSATGLKYQQQAETGGGEGSSEEPPDGGTPSGGTGSGGTTSGGGTSPTGTGSGATGGNSIGEAKALTPQTRITFGPASKTQAKRPVFRFTDTTGQPGTEFRCRIDRARWKGCGSPYRSKRLLPGKHTFSVKGINSGLRETQPVSRKFKVVGR
jgi:Tol biopolymer transport system component